MNTLKLALDSRGLTCLEAAKRGVPYHNIFKQYRGLRGVGPRSAILYERILGIPRSELRPDLWPPTTPPATSPAPAQAQAGAANI